MQRYYIQPPILKRVGGLLFNKSIEKKVNDMDITREQFQAFVDVQLSGVTNMMDTRRVAEETDGVLTKNDVRNIITHYNTLLTQYPDIKETVYAQG